MHNVLVTGGAGFIGSNLIRHLLCAEPQLRIVNLDALTYAGSTMNLDDLPDPSRHTFVRGDIGDRPLVERLLREHQIDAVEDQAYRPTSPYAASKAAADHFVRAYGRTYGLPVTLSNCTNNYGPRQFPEKLVPLVLLNAVAGKPIPVYGDGQQVRDWIHVQDHCEAVEIILRRGRPGETYHVGGGAPSTNLALIQQLCALLDDKRPNSPHRPHARLIQFVADRPAHDRRYDLNLEKIAATLDWSPRESLASGLAKTAVRYLGHLECVGAVRQQPGYVGWLERNYGARERSA